MTFKDIEIGSVIKDKYLGTHYIILRKSEKPFYRWQLICIDINGGHELYDIFWNEFKEVKGDYIIVKK